MTALATRQSGIDVKLTETTADEQFLREVTPDLLLGFDKQSIDYYPHYTLSGCNAINKYTHWCQCCLATIIAGTHADGHQVSALTHLSPAITNHSQRYFRDEYKRLLRQLRIQTIEGTRVSGLAGGLYHYSLFDRNFSREYRKMVQLIGSITSDELEIDTTVMSGPKFDRKGDGYTHLYYATQEQVAHILQTPQSTDIANHSFSYTQLPEQEERWGRASPLRKLWLKIRNSWQVRTMPNE